MATFQVLVMKCYLESTIQSLPKKNKVYLGSSEEYAASPFVYTLNLLED